MTQTGDETAGGCPEFLLAAARAKLRRGTSQANALFNLVTDLGTVDEKDLPCPVAQAQAALTAAALNVDDNSITLENLDSDVASCPVFQPLTFDYDGWVKSDTVSRFHRAQMHMARATADAYFKSLDGSRKNDAWMLLRLAFTVFTSIKRIGFSADVQSDLDDLASAYPDAQETAVKDYQDSSNGVVFASLWVPMTGGILDPLLSALEASDAAVTEKVKTLLTGNVPQLPSTSPRNPSPVFRRGCVKCTTGSSG